MCVAPVKSSTLKATGASTASVDKEPRPPTWKVWLTASRPHTLTASLSPVLVGYHLTAAYVIPEVGQGDDGEVYVNLPMLSSRWFLFCVLVQLGTNLHNDYADFVKGADDHRRVGQARAAQRGWLTPEQLCRASDVCLIAAAAVGLGLVRDSRAAGSSFDAPFAFVVASSLFNAVAYTGGPYPLGHLGLPPTFSIGYSGLGDVFVFAYFGLVATLTLPWLVAGPDAPWSASLVRASLPPSLLGTAIIVVNNLRDRHTDVRAGKRTLAVRCGPTFCRVEYAACVVGAYATAAWACAGSSSSSSSSYAWSLPLLSLPAAVAQLRAVSLGEKDGADLNPHVGGTARLQLLFCALYCVSLRTTAS